MKKSLQEQIERIHTLTYGKKIVKEGFLDDLLGKGKSQEQPQDQSLPKDVQDFYTTFENAINNGGLKQQSYGSMTFQKEAKAIQIGLILLGFELPKHGVDGLFGPETSAAIHSFKQQYGNLKESAEDIRLTLNSLGYLEKGNELSSGGQITNELSGVVDEILKEFKSIKPDVRVIVTGGNDKYHQGLGYQSKHTTGQALDLTLEPYNEENSKSFLNVLNKYKSQNNNFTFIDEYKNPSGANTGGHFHLQFGQGVAAAGGNQSTKDGEFASPEMLNKMLTLLKEKGITSEQLKQIEDTVTTGGGTEFVDLDINSTEGFKKYGDICQKFIEQRPPNLLGITGEMMAMGAKQAFDRYQKYVPAELALAQLALEGGIGNKDSNSRPIKTKNPFNVGNVDSGSNVFQSSVQNGINAYYNLVANNYIGKGKTAKDLLNNFVNHQGERYASGVDYEQQLNSIAIQAHKIAQPLGQTLGQTA